MNDFITLHKEEASKNMDIRKEILKAMANAGWQFRDSGTLCPIDVNVLEIRSCTAGIPPFCFTHEGEDWSWAAFNVGAQHLVCGQNSKHCIDLAAELLGDDALEAQIKAKLQLNEFGFRVEDILEKGNKVSSKKLAEMMRIHGGPWVAYKTTGVRGEGIRMLYRYDDVKGIYRYIGKEDMICLCRRVDPRVSVNDCGGVDTAIMTAPETRIETAICTDKIVVRGGKILDPRTMTTTDCSNEVFITSCLNARWDETPEEVKRTNMTDGGKMARKLLDGILDPQDRKVFLQYLAYTLTPGFHLKKFLILYGNSNCGKSTLISAWTEGVCPGETCTTFNPMDAFGGGDGRRFGLEGLIGKRIAYCDEWGSYRLSDDGPLKSVVCGRPVDIDIKGEPRRKLTPTCKLIAGTNIIPSFQDNSGAINNRLIILDFSRDPFDPASSPNFVPWYKNEDFCTVLLREAVLALNDSEDHCWGEENGEWYVKDLAKPSDKSKELLSKVRDESSRCLEVIAAMLTGGDEDTEVDQMLGVQWSKVQGHYKILYDTIHGKLPKDTTVPYINSTLIGTTIGGKHYQIHEAGTFRVKGKEFNCRNYMYEYSRNSKINAANKRKAGVWNIYQTKGCGNEVTFRKFLETQGLGEVADECMDWVREIVEETARLKTERNTEIAVG